MGAFQVLFVHSDGGGDAEAAIQERVEPAARRITEELGSMAGVTVAVVPVRETEAWALADGEAIRKAFGTMRDNAELGLPSNPVDVERIQDPKKALETCWMALRPKSRRRQRSATSSLEVIGELVRLDYLRAVPAFRRFEGDLRKALRDLRCLRLGDG